MTDGLKSGEEPRGGRDRQAPHPLRFVRDVPALVDPDGSADGQTAVREVHVREVQPDDLATAEPGLPGKQDENEKTRIDRRILGDIPSSLAGGARSERNPCLAGAVWIIVTALGLRWRYRKAMTTCSGVPRPCGDSNEQNSPKLAKNSPFGFVRRFHAEVFLPISIALNVACGLDATFSAPWKSERHR
jgi:hypothetical protein